jgi:hypothetical protein
MSSATKPLNPGAGRRRSSAAFALMTAWMAALLTGCLSEEGPTVAGADIVYSEIRVDAFSAGWKLETLKADSVVGGAVFTSFVTLDGLQIVEHRLLMDTSYDKRGQLPLHTVDTLNGDVVLFFPAEHEPKSFICLYSNDGMGFDPLSSEEDGIIREVIEVEGGNPQTYYWSLEPLPERVEKVPCRYYPGRGFRVPVSGIDVGTYIIRY